jgi:pimeloyl-ACP methyl ester carboxylesterase
MAAGPALRRPDDNRFLIRKGSAVPREDPAGIRHQQQGHGHTADIDRPLTFEQMADDTRRASWRPEDIQSINAPAMVMVGDADIVRPEHTVQMFRLLPHALLAVLPGTEHGAPVQRPDWIALMVKAFLDAPMPKAK